MVAKVRYSEERRNTEAEPEHPCKNAVAFPIVFGFPSPAKFVKVEEPLPSAPYPRRRPTEPRRSRKRRDSTEQDSLWHRGILAHALRSEIKGKYCVAQIHSERAHRVENAVENRNAAQRCRRPSGRLRRRCLDCNGKHQAGGNDVHPRAYPANYEKVDAALEDGERHHTWLRHSPKREEQKRKRIAHAESAVNPRSPVRVSPAYERAQCEREAQHVLARRKPCHGLHPQGMQGPQCRRKKRDSDISRALQLAAAGARSHGVAQHPQQHIHQ